MTRNVLIENNKDWSDIVGFASWNRFAGIKKIAPYTEIPAISRDFLMPNIDFQCQADDNLLHIRPLAVRPLTYSEGVPNPWGFFISVADFGVAGGLRHD